MSEKEERIMWVYICDDWIDGWIPVFLDDEPTEAPTK